MNPELDSTPACRDWMILVGLKPKDDWLWSDSNSRGWFIEVDSEGCLWIGDRCWFREPTRGQVRTLARLLHIELEEE